MSASIGEYLFNHSRLSRAFKDFATYVDGKRPATIVGADNSLLTISAGASGDTTGDPIFVLAQEIDKDVTFQVSLLDGQQSNANVSVKSIQLLEAGGNEISTVQTGVELPYRHDFTITAAQLANAGGMIKIEIIVTNADPSSYVAKYMVATLIKQ